MNNKYREGTFILTLAPLVLAAALMFAPPGAASERDDSCRRDYRMLTLGDEDRSADRMFFKVDKFSSWICDSTWQGREVVDFTREDHTKEGREILWRFIMDRKDLSLIEVTKQIKSEDGKIIKEERSNYENHFYKYPQQTYHVNALPALLSRSDIKPGWKKDIHVLVSPEMAPWKVTLRVEGEERVSVPAGSFDTYKVLMEFDYDSMMGKKWGRVVNMMSSFFPDYVYWVDKKATHYPIKFQGAMGPPFAAPEQVIELIKEYR